MRATSMKSITEEFYLTKVAGMTVTILQLLITDVEKGHGIETVNYKVDGNLDGGRDPMPAPEPRRVR